MTTEKSDSDALETISKFIQLGTRLDLKAVALETLLGISGTEEGINTLYERPDILSNLVILLDDMQPVIAKDSSFILINISADSKGPQKLLDVNLTKHSQPLVKPPDNIVTALLRHIFNKDSEIADQCCMILSNISRPPFLVDKIIKFIEKSEYNLEEIVNVFTKIKYNNKGANLNYLGPVLSNLTQNKEVRSYFLNKEKDIISRLLPFTEYKESAVRRGGVVGTIKNCCFDPDHHEWLLSDDVDILSRLLLPLAGNEEFDEEDNDKLPLDLQYLPSEKKREEDPDIRNMLLEALTQLCSKRTNREYIRNKNAYVILRELHKKETDKMALLSCENLVNILIRTEEEIGEENLNEIQVPEDLKEKFHQLDVNET